jgi:3-hydroxyisobutyrate dehydrogenase-like beta-hydroxyacid dehydrogenase
MLGTTETDTVIVSTIRPISQYMGKRIIDCGGPGNGSVVKLCNNLALASQMAGICEALVLSDAYNVDPTIVTNVMSVSTAKCWSNDINNPHPIVANQQAKRAQDETTTTTTTTTTTNSSPVGNKYNGGFASALILKDINLALQAASEKGVHLPTTTLTASLYEQITNSGLGSKDFGILFQYLKDNNNINK